MMTGNTNTPISGIKGALSKFQIIAPSIKLAYRNPELLGVSSTSTSKELTPLWLEVMYS
jgi:hypothetical protein